MSFAGWTHEPAGKIGLSKTQFFAFPGPELVNQKRFFQALKNAHKK